MNIHPILLRGLLTTVVVEMMAKQCGLLCSVDGGVRIAAEDHFVDRVVDYSQKSTVAARASAEKRTLGHRS